MLLLLLVLVVDEAVVPGDGVAVRVTTTVTGPAAAEVVRVVGLAAFAAVDDVAAWAVLVAAAAALLACRVPEACAS